MVIAASIGICFGLMIGLVFTIWDCRQIEQGNYHGIRGWWQNRG